MRHHEPMRRLQYQIQVQGNLDDSWSAWMGDMRVVIADDITTFTGYVFDQAALRGMLCRLWDLNMTLVSVRIIEADAQAGD